MTPITTERLTLRLPEVRDLAPYTAYCRSPRARFVGGPFSTVQAFEKLSAMAGHWTLRGFGRLVFHETATGAQLGHVGALQLDAAEPPEMTWTLWRAESEGQGYATEAARAFLARIAPQLGLTRMLIRLDRDNHASLRLAARLGARPLPDPPPAWMPHARSFEIMTGSG
ncbi:GNAT family N-acetyltransferase [Dinoroseobacter sp. S76]|uniref:GNAT family N-acetyltransferase n=1 Tax=Dinoroseobacter sp. S76 TaxID=3415124 RepID=UPI003C7D62E0